MSETNDNRNAYRLRELSDGLDKLAGLARELCAGALPALPAIDVVWAAAPLVLRLKFARDILPVESTLQPALRQASAIEELRLRGDELETWLIRYPTLFADAVTLLSSVDVRDSGPALESEPAIILAMSTLADAQQRLEQKLAVYGIVWISPTPGEPITSDHEVVAEENSEQRRGTIARSIRPGFKRSGKLELPAQVGRSIGPAFTPLEEHTHASYVVNTQFPTPNIDIPTPPHPSVPSGQALTSPDGGAEPVGPTLNVDVPSPNTEHRTPITHPEWLAILGQRTHGCDVEPVSELIRQLRELVAAVVQPNSFETGDYANRKLESLLAPLAALLSMRYADGLPGISNAWGEALLEARDPILQWLRVIVFIEPISPQRGDGFDEALMEAVETRRTVHANEIETVARVEGIGFMRCGSPLLRAKVVRYTAGKE